jgi:membrane-associated phospholipid phosphatase
MTSVFDCKSLPVSKKSLLFLALGAAVLGVMGFFLLDRPLAEWVHGAGIERNVVIVWITENLDLITAHSWTISRSLYGPLLGWVLVALGAIGLLVRRDSLLARALLFTGAGHVLTLFAVGSLKSTFGRMRPFQLLASGDWDHLWFIDGGSSFPSGHIAFYWGLFLPLIYLFPKYRVPLFIIPIFFVFGRIDENAHFLSDVCGAIVVAALVTAALAALSERWIRPQPVTIQALPYARAD